MFAEWHAQYGDNTAEPWGDSWHKHDLHAVCSSRQETYPGLTLVDATVES